MIKFYTHIFFTVSLLLFGHPLFSQVGDSSEVIKKQEVEQDETELDKKLVVPEVVDPNPQSIDTTDKDTARSDTIVYIKDTAQRKEDSIFFKDEDE